MSKPPAPVTLRGDSPLDPRPPAHAIKPCGWCDGFGSVFSRTCPRCKGLKVVHAGCLTNPCTCAYCPHCDLLWSTFDNGVKCLMCSDAEGV